MGKRNTLKLIRLLNKNTLSVVKFDDSFQPKLISRYRLSPSFVCVIAYVVPYAGVKIISVNSGLP
jgi:hypothetical protein